MIVPIALLNCNAIGDMIVKYNESALNARRCMYESECGIDAGSSQMCSVENLGSADPVDFEAEFCRACYTKEIDGNFVVDETLKKSVNCTEVLTCPHILNQANGGAADDAEGLIVNDCSYETSCKTGYENIKNDGQPDAYCDIITYTITYNNMDGAENSRNNPATYTVEDSIVFENATKDGYTFVGWFLDAEYTNGITEIAKGTIGDKVLYAKWSQNQMTYNFKCDYNYIGDLASGSVYVGEDITVPFVTSCAKSSEHAFSGWVCTKNNTFVKFYDKDVSSITSSIDMDTFECVAQWDKCELGSYLDTDTLSCVVCPETHPYSDEYAVSEHKCYTNKECPALTCPEKSTCSYVGETEWREYYNVIDTDQNHCEIQVESCEDGYKLYNKQCVLDDYDITYISKGNVLDLQPNSYTAETERIMLPEITKTDFVFDGWCDGVKYCENPIKEYVVDKSKLSDKTFYAQWTEICPAEYPLSDSEVFNRDKCYKLCPEKQYASGVTGGIYYDGTNTCDYSYVCESDVWFHIGDEDKVCLSTEKITSPSMVFEIS
nr:InlB B-repeat-containing protein [Candidatus Enterousia merdequi]